MLCKNCNNKLQQRQHKFLKEKMLKQPYFFLRWYKCLNCNKQFNFEDDKIFNHTSYYREVEKEKTILERCCDELDDKLKEMQS